MPDQLNAKIGNRSLNRDINQDNRATSNKTQTVSNEVKSHSSSSKQTPDNQSTSKPKAKQEELTNRIQLKGEETDENVDRFLKNLTQQYHTLNGVKRGRIIGNNLNYNGKAFSLTTRIPLEPNLTLSTKLGEGVFLLSRSLLGRELSLAWFLREKGPIYDILTVYSKGHLVPTTIEVLVNNLNDSPDRILVYSTRTMIMPETDIVGQKPSNLKELLKLIVNTMDRSYSGPFPESRRPTARALLSILKPENLNSQQMMQIMYDLKNLKKLTRFLSFIPPSPELRNFLRNKGVPWDFIFMNYEASVEDWLAFGGGFTFAFTEWIFDTVEEVFYLIKNKIPTEFLELISRGTFYVNMKYLKFLSEVSDLGISIIRFLYHPYLNSIMFLVKILRDLREQISNAFWNLDYFELGRIIGNIVSLVVDAILIIMAIPKAAMALSRIISGLGELTLDSLRKWGIRAIEINEVLAEKSVAPKIIELSNGSKIMSIANEKVVLDQKGGKMAKLNRSEVDAIAKDANKGTLNTLKEADRGIGPKNISATSYLNDFDYHENAWKPGTEPKLGITKDKFWLVRAEEKTVESGKRGSYYLERIFYNPDEAYKFAEKMANKGEELIRQKTALPRVPDRALGEKELDVLRIYQGEPGTKFLEGPIAPQREMGKVYVPSEEWATFVKEYPTGPIMSGGFLQVQIEESKFPFLIDTGKEVPITNF